MCFECNRYKIYVVSPLIIIREMNSIRFDWRLIIIMFFCSNRVSLSERCVQLFIVFPELFDWNLTQVDN